MYELAKARLRRFQSRFGGIKSFLDGYSRRERDTLGAKGERLAIRRLRREGYRVVARNYRAVGAEIDAVAMDGDTLVFVEVKTRTGFRNGTSGGIGPRPQTASNPAGSGDFRPDPGHE